MGEIPFRGGPDIAAQAQLLGLNTRAPRDPFRLIPLASGGRRQDLSRQNIISAASGGPSPAAPDGTPPLGMQPGHPVGERTEIAAQFVPVTMPERRDISPREAARERLSQFFSEHEPDSDEVRAVRDRLLYESAKSQGRIFTINESGIIRFNAYRESIAADYPGQYTNRELLALLSFTSFEDILPELQTPRTTYTQTLLTTARDLLGNYASAVKESEIEGAIDVARERQRTHIAVDKMQRDMDAWFEEHNQTIPFSLIIGAEKNIAKLSALEIPEVPVVIGENNRQEITIGEHLGNGNSGKVFEATMDGQEYAIKLPLTVWPDIVQEFSSEAALQSAVDNPHVTSLVQSDTMRLPNGRILPYILMEKAEATLEQVMDGNPLPLEEILRLSIHTADAYAAIYENGLLFSAPGLDDVLLFRGAQGEPVWKLADFGGAMLAKNARFESHPDAIAQEIWATKILYPAVTGIDIAASEIPPFEDLIGAENMTVYHRVLENVLRRATQRESKDRYPSMKALRDDLLAKIAAAKEKIVRQ